jgi:hypothetical protein
LLTRSGLALLACASLLAAMPAPIGRASGDIGRPSIAPKTVVSSVTGNGTLKLSATSPALAAPFAAGDRLHLILTARMPSNGRACSATRPCGRFVILDQKAKGRSVLLLTGSVTCAAFAGSVASVTGTVKAGFTTPRTTSVAKSMVGITVADNAGAKGADLVGLSVASPGGVAASTCAAGTPAATLTVTHGNFTVHSATP